jgi:hypothetical protein
MGTDPVFSSSAPEALGARTHKELCRSIQRQLYHIRFTPRKGFKPPLYASGTGGNLIPSSLVIIALTGRSRLDASYPITDSSSIP